VNGGGPLLVLHDSGDELGGQEWRDAFEALWNGPVVAPDLPGHGQAAVPLDGSYELVDAAWFGLRVLHDLEVDVRPVVLGVGVNGWSAELLALGGRARALVLVDGLGGPWATPAEWVQTQRAWARGVADDEAAVSTWAGPGLDPRLRHGISSMTARPMAERAAAALDVPVLIVETPESWLEPGEVDDLARRMKRCTVEQVPRRRPGHVAPVAGEWAGMAGAI